MNLSTSHNSSVSTSFVAKNDASVQTSKPTTPFQRICILHHPKKPESQTLAETIGAFLTAHAVKDVYHGSAWDTALPRIDLDLLITLGGDGTLLRGAGLGAQFGLPMLGVKMGRSGFLAEVMPDDRQRPLLQLMGGDDRVEERLMVRAHVERKTSEGGVYCTICEYDALNDVVFSRGDLARVVRISAQLDGGYLTQYTCDGLIVSTATGSTGYALAVGGPILPPELSNMLLIPIAPHLSMDRAVVLSEGTEVRMRAYSDHRPILTVDGQVVVEIEEGDEVVVVSSPHKARFIRLRERSYFYQSLMEKMKWSG